MDSIDWCMLRFVTFTFGFQYYLRYAHGGRHLSVVYSLPTLAWRFERDCAIYFWRCCCYGTRLYFPLLYPSWLWTCGLCLNINLATIAMKSKYCPGSNERTQDCQNPEPYTTYTPWGTWSECDHSCGTGFRKQELGFLSSNEKKNGCRTLRFSITFY